jgi:hypothetical protein
MNQTSEETVYGTETFSLSDFGEIVRKYGNFVVCTGIIALLFILFAAPAAAVSALGSTGICGKIAAPTSSGSYVMSPGMTYDVELTFKNTGSTVWTETNRIRLGPTGDGVKFTPERIQLPAGQQVKKGQEYTFHFKMTAPAKKGTYYPAYRMVRDTTSPTWFGSTAKWRVVVK